MDQDNISAIELLKSILAQSSETRFYLHYEPSSGKIMHLRNYLEVDQFPYLEFTEIEENLNINDYQIIEKEGKRQLVKKDKFIDKISKIDDNIYQIPKRLADPSIKVSQITYQFDILIEQDNIKKEFRIRLSGMIKDQYYQTAESRQVFVCYVTSENDPNVLYKTLDLPLAKLLQYHYYTIPYDDYDGTPCNIFSMRYFQNYLHLVIE